ncbi:hypothetical protein CB1_000322003 [Camelus ferus]|nr:hypothetical protein CB1_000322003 [Camelus ferus]
MLAQQKSYEEPRDLLTVQEEEREIYRQLLQVVTGKQFSVAKPTTHFPLHLTSVYDSRARERLRHIEEQKALALQLQNQRLQEREHSIHDSVELHLRVPLEKEIPVTIAQETGKKGHKLTDSEDEFPEITEEMEKEIKNVFRNGNQDEVLSEAFRLTITRKDIQTLNHLNWLNDEVSSSASVKETLLSYNQFRDVFPLWMMVYLVTQFYLRLKQFASARQYLKQESIDKKRREFDTNGWQLFSKKSQEIPQQMNGSDCGMFACKYADCITKDRPINFTQEACFSLWLVTRVVTACATSQERRRVVGHALCYRTSHTVVQESWATAEPSLLISLAYLKSCKKQTGPEQVCFSFPLFG